MAMVKVTHTPEDHILESYYTWFSSDCSASETILLIHLYSVAVLKSNRFPEKPLLPPLFVDDYHKLTFA